MAKKLSWAEIEEQYNQEWVQLIDYDWPEGRSYPLAGVVRVHASSRKEFNRRVLECERPKNAARVFVGRPKISHGTIISCNSVRISKCE